MVRKVRKNNKRLLNLQFILKIAGAWGAPEWGNRRSVSYDLKCFSDIQQVSGTMGELLEVDFGGPLHCFILCGDMHPLEQDYFNSWKQK